MAVDATSVDPHEAAWISYEQSRCGFKERLLDLRVVNNEEVHVEAVAANAGIFVVCVCVENAHGL